MDEPEEVTRRRKQRNIALGLALGALAALFFAMSIVQWATHTPAH
jgi:hypothetical protein